MPQGHGTRLSHPSRTSIKASPEPLSLTHSSSSLQLLLLPITTGTLHTTPMACNSLCSPCGPTPLANSCNEPCALQCQDSRVIINPSPVMVTLPGPIMTSFPQNTAVGSTSSAALGTELNAQGQPISGGFGFGLGYGLGGLGCYGRRGYGSIC
ncbi:feather beta keratin-like [Ammospiza caudacuta]|uniref:feather beta keratin-like n=2 Tax=Ammospiza caudacuta TaxID=2857398 RepID=UPI00273A005C|nr:feather beta keratin-like [Ammospiza caudacuta]